MTDHELILKLAADIDWHTKALLINSGTLFLLWIAVALKDYWGNK
jgi:hypothetical protein